MNSENYFANENSVYKCIFILETYRMIEFKAIFILLLKLFSMLYFSINFEYFHKYFCVSGNNFYYKFEFVVIILAFKTNAYFSGSSKQPFTLDRMSFIKKIN